MPLSLGTPTPSYAPVSVTQCLSEPGSQEFSLQFFTWIRGVQLGKTMAPSFTVTGLDSGGQGVKTGVDFLCRLLLEWG